MTQYTEQVPATSDAKGAISFTLTNPPPGTVLTGAISVPDAPSGATFHATAADTDWGTWTGPALHNPVQTNAQIPIVVTGTGLVPNTAYNLTFTGTQQPSGTEPAVWPTTALTTPFVAQTLQPFAQFTFPKSAGFQLFGPYPTQGFASLRLLCTSPLSSGELDTDILWTDASGNVVASRDVVYSDAAQLEMQVPHLGEFVKIIITNFTANDLAGFVEVAQTTETAGTWGGVGYLINTVSVPHGTTATIISGLGVFSGPAFVHINPGGATDWVSHLYSVDDQGNRKQVARWDQADLGTAHSIRELVIVPPTPLEIDFADGDTSGTATPTAALILDLWRVG